MTAQETATETAAPALRIRGLRVAYESPRGLTEVVRDVSISVEAGETLCIVGESGCGKSAMVLAAAALLPPTGRVLDGSVTVAGREVVGQPEEALVGVRGRGLGMVFQESLAALNPLMTVGRQVAESLKLHRALSGKPALAEAERLLTEVGIGDASRRLGQYPHELSGGMRQRVAIAIALAANPAVLIADEPTTALDVTVQAQLLELLRREQRSRSMALLLITHDLGVVASIADRVAVMYAGEIVEHGPVDDLFANPRHPYTAGLLESLPRLADDADVDLPVIPGQPPPLGELPAGCAFRPRCGVALERCATDHPTPAQMGPTEIACWNAGAGR